MRPASFVTIVAAILFASTRLLHASENTELSIELKQGRLVRFDARATSYADVLRLLAILAGERIEIVSTPTVRLFVGFENVTPGQALESVLSSQHLSVERRSGVYRVTRRK